VTQQGTLIMATFMTDQMEKDLKRQELVDQGQISQVEADEQAADWEKVGSSILAFLRLFLLLCVCVCVKRTVQ
jgi:hypothetical protein